MSASRWFAIRKRGTNEYLPSVSSYGFTRTEPTLDQPPRLFRKRENATQALLWWLKGEAFEHREGGDTDIGTSTLTIRVLPRSDRRRDDFEIVVISLSAITLEAEALSRL